MKFQIPLSIESARPYAHRTTSQLYHLAGLIGLSCCTESPAIVTMQEPVPIPDLALPMDTPDMSASMMNLDPAVTISVSDCTTASLIQAINAANDEVAHPGPDVIGLQGGCVYTLTRPDNWWYGPTGLPPIKSDITIQPAVAGSSVIIERNSFAPKFRLFYVNGAPTTNVLPGVGSLTLKNLTLRNGLALGGSGAPQVGGTGGGGGGGLGAGGAIFAQGTVTLSGMTLTDNTAQGGSGTVGAAIGAGGGMGGDGGLMEQSSYGSGGGGGMKDTGGSGALGVAGDGGDGPLAGAGGKGGKTGVAGMGGDTGGSEHGGNGSATAGGSGGGARGLGGRGGNAAVNFGDGGGGGQNLGGGGGGAGFGGMGGTGGSSGTHDPGGGGAFGGGGGGATTDPSTTAGGGGGIGGGGGGNRGAGGFGGGGAGGGGGGGFGGGGGRSSGPSVFGGGRGAISSSAIGGGGGGAGLGGAVFLMYGSLTVVNSTLSGNLAQGGDGGGAGIGGQGMGGAVFVLNGTMTVLNATLSSNAVANGIGSPSLLDNGRAIYVVSFGKDTLGTADATATLTLSNSILADNVPCGSSADRALVADQRAGMVLVNAILPNLIESHAELGSAILVGSPIVADPNLDVLKRNGGPTSTQTITPQSPAVDAGDLGTCTQGPVGGQDQRGRPRGTTKCHLGAVEQTATTQPSGCACMITTDCSSTQCMNGFCE